MPTPARFSPDTWKKVDPLLDAALDLDGEARRRWLEDLHGREPELAPLVASLVATHERAERSQEMETVPRLAPAPPASSAFRAGEPVGPFRLVRPLGRGGMGEVWLALQVDGRVQRQVALKLPDLLGAGSLRAERFARERDILAKLEHPHIARFLDAGVAEGGQPYLAMELVEGEPLDAYLRTRSLPVPARLALLRQVLEAVAHAHRRLVVHRDLKPANILVDAAGQVKLLDFGIAKLVGDEPVAGEEAAPDLTRVGGRLMTLRYAAPEQAEGGDITTATDIYSLGVVLHEALTGLSPYRPVREGRPLTATALASAEIARPSTLVPAPLSRELSGDLDAIVLKALRRDPAERYATVDDFDDDLRRHLEHLPVHARAGTWRYLAGRFARRHRLPIAMAAGVVIALAAGLVVAEHERREAEAERARAERHLAGVRKLANTFIFDVHGAIEKLPGTLEARRMLVRTSLEYLDALAAESGDDSGLQREIAAGYRKIAQIEGDTQGANVGESGAARLHAAKSVALLEAITAREPGDIATLRELRASRSLHAQLLKDAGDVSAVATREAALDAAARVIALPAATLDDRREHAMAIADLALDLSVVKSDHAAARERIGEATQRLDALAREAPGERPVRISQASAYERASIIVEQSIRTEDLPRAIELLEKSVALTEALFAEDRLDQRLEQAVITRRTNLAGTQRLIGDLPGAAANLARARELSAAAWAREPGNAGSAVTHLRVLVVSVMVEQAQGRNEAAVALAREVFALEAKLPEGTRAALRVRANVSVAKAYSGLALVAMAGASRAATAQRLALAREARANLVEARDFRQELVDRNVDAATSRILVQQIGAAIRDCDVLIARLQA